MFVQGKDKLFLFEYQAQNTMKKNYINKNYKCSEPKPRSVIYKDYCKKETIYQVTC